MTTATPSVHWLPKRRKMPPPPPSGWSNLPIGDRQAPVEPKTPERLTPPLKWHGGKYHQAQKIIKLMPPHLHYVEPYFGGGAVLLAKNPDGVSEVVNDLDGRLINFLRVMQGDETLARFRRRMEATPFSEVEWNEAMRAAVQGFADPMDDAVAFFIECRQSLAGRRNRFASISRSRTRRGMNEQASAWLTTVEGLPAVSERLRRVVILNRPALDVIRSEDTPKTLFYLDPPYLHETRKATRVYGDYEMSEGDHRDLLELLPRLRGKVMLSGYRSALYDEALSGWTRHEFPMPNHAAGGQTKRRMIECVWCNFG